MGREKQIEEMARVACEHFDCDMVGQPCTKCKTYDKHCYTIHQAEILYNAGYRKTFTSDLVSDTQKAYKEGYEKGFLDGREEFDIILQQNKQLLQAREISKSDIERLKTQLQQANAGIVNCSGCHLVELNAVKDFAEKLKEKYGKSCSEYYPILIEITSDDIDELLKEYEK